MLETICRLSLLSILAAGAAAGQTNGFAIVSAPLSPSAVFPPQEDVDAGGEAVILIHLKRDSGGALIQAILDFRLEFASEAPGTVTKLHLHRAGLATKGPVVINADLGPEVAFEAGDTSLFRQKIVIDQDGLDAVEDILANPSGFYLNVHSAANPDGMIRGQLMRSDGAAVAALQEQLAALGDSNAEMAAELASIKQTLARLARRLGVVPAE